MEVICEDLIEQAVAKYRTIYPCGLKKSLAECFTLQNNRVVFWFNTEDQSTHMLMRELQD
jgi:hypothetical protein